MYKNYASWKPSTVQGSIDNSNCIPEKSFITQTDTNPNNFSAEITLQEENSSYDKSFNTDLESPQKQLISLPEETSDVGSDESYSHKNKSEQDKFKEPVPHLKLLNQNQKTEIFKIVSDKIDSLYTQITLDSIQEKKEENFLGKKRNKTRRPRKDNNDNIRKKIKRGFLNASLIKKLNDKLKNIGSKLYFERFPCNFACDVHKKRNKEILDMKLKDIFEKEELYMNETDKGKLNYLHNLKVVQSQEIRQNKGIKNILNMTFVALYKEYINSNEFETEETARLKKKKMKDAYIQNYKIIAKGLIEFFDS